MPDYLIPEERRVIVAGPLSKKGKFSLAAEGEFGTREIKHLIALLQIQLEWTAEDEAAALAATSTGDGEAEAPDGSL